MDITLITSIASSLKAAKDATEAMLSIRDFNNTAALIAPINDQLLKAQQDLFVYMGQLLELQAQMARDRDELSKLQGALEERGRYSLFELSTGVFVYRFNDAPAGSDGNPTTPQPVHYLCQPCFDKGTKSVLQRLSAYGRISLDCSICKARHPTGEAIPAPAFRVPGAFS
ncbi:hypothetical protein [Xanthomonas hortorum]|uniref:Uncharacterized protein n=1 Tax=Xanthomonas hortorum pv. vitians TaxID=83224 RepID=A0AAW8ZSA4_9XANT|nr:hypothetical protein [Xanthomonas hortorum]MCE4302365.1 hypothetical protein [Xanthomonas hortorum pv. vitians]MDT7826195.1 hypothetical protein [Xanthomonas hortorum pv. vitians]MDV7248609.1 hypothetical protein [Xanthomonas hortorum pv. vitians]NMI32461.1 hypothetical protein [Xanthomonas hortorum pv. vitians]